MFEALTKLYRHNFNVFLFLSTVGLTYFAWLNRFIQDDAFISFRYAYNFVNGEGLVWNAGERVEGYTNFLWTLAMAIPISLDINPEIFSFCLGIICFIVSIYFTYRLSVVIFDSRNIALLTMFLLGTNYTFSAYATGGLETQLQTSMFVLSVFLLLRSMRTGSWEAGSLLTLSLVTSGAVLTRLDSALMVAVVFTAAALHLVSEKTNPRARIMKLLALIGPFLIIVGSWLFWKYQYYGDILPNTYYAKMPTIGQYKNGVFYLVMFSLSYLLVPFLFLAGFHAKKLLRTENRHLFILAVLVVLWSLYVVRVGGDYMEFRFMVPILPLVFIFISWLVFVCVKKKEIQIILVLFVLAGALHHRYGFGVYFDNRHITTIEKLSVYYPKPERNWPEAGRVLGKLLRYDQDILIATGAAGAIPYFSRLRTIDQLGLNDKWIARNGRISGLRPGHQRRSTLDYLLKRNVDLVLGGAKLDCGPGIDRKKFTVEYLRRYGVIITKRSEIPDHSQILEIPINQNCSLMALYLTDNARIAAAIERNSWNVYPVEDN